MNDPARVAVVMGGYSTERDVSIASGQAVMRALENLGYDAVSLDFDASFVDTLREMRPDVVFNALHGVGGEDGVVQGILEWMRLPYTGSGVRASALSMDKNFTKKLLAAEGLPTAPWEAFELDSAVAPPLPETLNLPLVLKPCTEGSSVGVHIVRTREEWSRAIGASAACVRNVLAEEYIDGREFTCGILCDQALPVLEIVSRGAFYSFDAKYATDERHHEVPARIDEDLARRLQSLALSVHRLIGLRDYSRTDFIVSKEGRPYILEVNALTGLTPASLLPDECAAIGISYDTLIDRLTTAALERGKKACV